jgi:hypothetical protein
MRYRFALPRCVVGALAGWVTLAGLLATPALAAPTSPADTHTVAGARNATPVPPTGSVFRATDRAVRGRGIAPAQLTPLRTDNGGITLEGAPSNPHNQPVSIMYQKASDDGFTARIWNPNHEYTHFLDARDDMKGDFAQQTTVPDVWWIEGLAEYSSYGYRDITDDQAVAETGKHTYALSTLFQNTYANSDVTRTYPWGYLAVRYMFERHPADIQSMLAHFRAGDYAGGYAVYASGIGTRYDADFDDWLTACAAGACAEPGGSSPSGMRGRATATMVSSSAKRLARTLPDHPRLVTAATEGATAYEPHAAGPAAASSRTAATAGSANGAPQPNTPSPTLVRNSA